MSTIVYRISVLLGVILAEVPLARIWGCSGSSGRSSLVDFCSVGARFFPRWPTGDFLPTPCAALVPRWHMDVGPFSPSLWRGNRSSSRKTTGTPIGMKGSAR